MRAKVCKKHYDRHRSRASTVDRTKFNEHKHKFIFCLFEWAGFWSLLRFHNFKMNKIHQYNRLYAKTIIRLQTRTHSTCLCVSGRESFDSSPSLVNRVLLTDWIPWILQFHSLEQSISLISMCVSYWIIVNGIQHRSIDDLHVCRPTIWSIATILFANNRPWLILDCFINQKICLHNLRA